MFSTHAANLSVGSDHKRAVALDTADNNDQIPFTLSAGFLCGRENPPTPTLEALSGLLTREKRPSHAVGIRSCTSQLLREH